jgi:dTMP kinase
MHRGQFITFEGIDGCGKTTQFRMLGKWLRERGQTVVETVEPGGTAIGQQIRKILLDPENAEIQPRTELLLYFASRAQNVDQVIRPGLDSGAVVLCDRFTDSTLVYQGGRAGNRYERCAGTRSHRMQRIEARYHLPHRYRSRDQSHEGEAAQ